MGGEELGGKRLGDWRKLGVRNGYMGEKTGNLSRRQEREGIGRFEQRMQGKQVTGLKGGWVGEERNQGIELWGWGVEALCVQGITRV